MMNYTSMTSGLIGIRPKWNDIQLFPLLLLIFLPIQTLNETNTVDKICWVWSHNIKC